MHTLHGRTVLTASRVRGGLLRLDAALSDPCGADSAGPAPDCGEGWVGTWKGLRACVPEEEGTEGFSCPAPT